MKLRLHRPALLAILILSALCSALVSLTPVAAHAGHSHATRRQAITLSPASSSPSAKPGGTVSNSMSLLNESDHATTVRLYTKPYHVENGNYDPKFTQLPGTTDAAQWVHLGKSTLSVPAGKLVSVPYTLQIPSGTAPGGYYAVIFVETQPQAGGKGVRTHNRVGNVLYITAEGKVKKGGSVSLVNLPHFSTKSNLPMSLDVRNTGGLHFLTNARMSVTNVFGKTVFRANLERYVLPQTMRTVTANWRHTPPLGVYKVARSATVNGQMQTLPSQWIVIVHPWVLIAVTVLILLAIGAALWPRLRGNKAQTKPKAKR